MEELEIMEGNLVFLTNFSSVILSNLVLDSSTSTTNETDSSFVTDFTIVKISKLTSSDFLSINFSIFKKRFYNEKFEYLLYREFNLKPAKNNLQQFKNTHFFNIPFSTLSSISFFAYSHNSVAPSWMTFFFP